MHVFLAVVLTILLAPLLMAAELGQPKDIVFEASVDGSKEHYIEMLPGNFEPAVEHDVLIALHGHGSDRQQYATQQRGECKSARDLAAKYEMIFISPDYRAATSWMGPKAEADLVQIISELKKRHRVGKVVLAGGSMGGTSVLIFTALHPELVAGVCSVNGTANMIEYANFGQAIAASYGGTKDKIPDEYKKRSPELAPERFTMPISFTTGGKDTAVPPQSVHRLANAIEKSNSKVLLIHREEGGHSTSYDDAYRALEFVIKNVRGDKLK